MATLTGVPVEEYLRTSYHPDREYVRGEVVERRGFEYDHSRMQVLLACELCARQRERRYRTFIALRVHVSDDIYRVPDLCVKAFPHQETPVMIRPDLVIEIVSPDDEPVEMIAKIADYQAASIPYIWVANPHKRTLIEADPSSIRRPAGLVLATPLVGEVDFASLFAKLDEPSE
jgi:Uma2 family endonuclease